MKLSYLIDTLITPNITGLSFVDRYAGVVRTLNIAVDDQSDKSKVKRLPVACNVVSPDCANPTQSPTYDDLVPDDSKSSVIYWEVIQPMTDAGEQPTGNFYERKLKGTARIVVWLNLAKLGFDGCNDGIEIVRELEKAIAQKGRINGGVYDGSHVWIRPRAQVKQDINTIFGQYDYKKLKNYYLYPFNFFAIDVDFLLYDCLQQGATVPTDTRLDCENQVNPVTPPFSNVYSMLFDGVNEYISAGDQPVFDLGSTMPYTFTIWAKPSSIMPVNNIIFSKYDLAQSNGYFLGFNGAGQLRFAIQRNATIDGLEVVTTNTVTLNTWQHIAVTYDGSLDASGVKIYIDGVLQAVTVSYNTLTSIPNNSASFVFGAIPAASRYYNGYLDEFRMWNIEKPLLQIQDDYNAGSPDAPETANLVSRCAFGDGGNFVTPNWVLPDEVGAFDYTSVNMENSDRTTDTP